MSNQTLNRMLDDFYPYAKEYLGFDKDAKISFASDKNNANKPLGKTAYYDPSNYSVTVYTDNRHPKDIMRSVSHELVHHAQNCRGDLNMSEDTGEGYAQNNEHLREMEREAYEKGNLCFRDWEDGIKSNLEPGTIYESRARRSKKSMNNFKTLSENFKSFLQQENEAGSYQAGDKVKDLRNDTVGTVVEPMAGGAVIELEDGTIVKTRDKFLEKVEGESVNENAPPKASDGYHIHPGRTPVRVVSGSLKGAEGKAIEITTSTKGETAIVVELTKNADQKVFGQVSDEVIVLPGDVETIGTDMADDPKMDYYNDMPSKDGELNEGGSMAEYGKIDAEDGNPPSKIGRGNPEYMEAYNAVLIARGEEPLDVQQPDQAYLDALRSGNLEEDNKEEYNGHLWENKIDKIVDMVMKEYGDHETQARGGMVSSTYSSDPEMDQIEDIAAQQKDWGLLSISKALKEQGFDVTLTNAVLVIDNKYFMGKPEKFDISPDEEVREIEGSPLVLGRMGGQMEEGMGGGFDVSQIQSREDEKYGGMIHMLPDIQFTGDIAADMQSAPAELLSWLYGELESGDSIQDSAGRVYSGSDVQDVVNDMPDEMFAEGESRHNTPDFFDSDEEKEMMKKMSNKEFYDYVTRGKHTTANLRDEPSMGGGGPIDGMEGPFQYKSGAVLYYDPKEGKYYDRSRDQYLDNEEAAKLTMENTQMKLKNVSLREKVKNSVMSKLKEMYDDDDMYGDEDPYMASLEAEFPWMKDDKKGGKMSKADLAAMQAAEKDAQMDPDMMAQMQAGLDDMAGTSEDDDDPVVTMKEDDVDFAEALRARVLNRIQEMSLSEEEQESTEKHDDDPALKGDQDELPDELQAAIIDKADDEGEKKEESLRDKVYRIVQETLNEEEHEDDEKEEVEEGKGKFVYATDPKTAETDKNASDARNAYKPKNKDEDDDEEKNEGKMKYSREDDEEKEEVEEGKYKREDDEDKEDVEENIAANPEDFFRKLRNESRTIKQDNWNDSHRSKRSSMLNERLMKSWFNK